MNSHQLWLRDLRRERVALGLAVSWRRVFLFATLGALLLVLAWEVAS